MTILDDIVKYKRHEELPKLMKIREPALVQAEAALAPPPQDFIAALRAGQRIALIAEVKKASPSKGLLRRDFDPLALATTYAQNGAAAISVLTDRRYFQGSLDYLTQIRDRLQELSGSSRPALLRKDFIFHPYQVYEARSAGADALLLIAAVLGDQELAHLLNLTRKLKMTALIEVHNQAELERVLPLEPRLVDGSGLQELVGADIAASAGAGEIERQAGFAVGQGLVISKLPANGQVFVKRQQPRAVGNHVARLVAGIDAYRC